MKGSTLKTITVEEALKVNNPVFIDVRSPGEYADGTIPGAINIPIFSDEERAEVGTTYKQIDPEKARELGLELVAPKLPEMVKAVKEAAGDRTPVVFCWRGGSRSESICQILGLMGVKGYRLEGGYKKYRQMILDSFETYDFPPQGIVLHGYTGSGKTEILHRLAELGHPVLDLEGLAGHRGSAFGGIGIAEIRNQKQFDALLYNRLEELKHERFVLMEAESKRIGRVNMPDFLFMKKEKGMPILVNTSLEIRAERIIEEYAREGITAEFMEKCQGSLCAIEKKLVMRIGKEGFTELMDKLTEGDLLHVTRVLLAEYYDPMYQHSQDKYSRFVLEVDADDLEQAVREIDQFLRERCTAPMEYAESWL